MGKPAGMRTASLFGEDEVAKKEVVQRAAEPREQVGEFVSVALNRPVDREFTYSVPEDFVGKAVAGSRVAVPFGPRRHIGVVVGTSQTCTIARGRIKPIAAVLDPEPIVGEDLLALTRWIADRYACSWGEALAAVLPAPLKRSGGRRMVVVVEVQHGVGREELQQVLDRFPKQHRLLRTLLEIGGPTEMNEVLRRLHLSDSPLRSLERRGWVLTRRIEAQPDELATATGDRPRHANLSVGQEQALEAILPRIEAGKHGTFLLHGVTGSGKTEVYLRAIESSLAAGRGAIVLVPEIALTPQTVGWFRSRFGEVAVLHSHMTDAQRLDMWKRVGRGEARVVVGARSAIFAPMADIGVIVVDEEHEPSFKQESVPRYHARDVAVERARSTGAVCILGSATPSLESWAAANGGAFERIVLPERVGGGRMPDVKLVDMRLEPGAHGAPPTFSRLLKHHLREALEEKEQAILFLNRRGFTPCLWCPGCKSTLQCSQCASSLTWHRRIGRMVCHCCLEEREPITNCPTCSRPGLKAIGSGSERVEREVCGLFPDARVRRMDSDTMRRREDYEETLSAFGRGEIDILVGTQMIAKGLDFPGVTVVGIVSADMALHLPDFRASERTYQLIAQVAGRAGRGELAGRIVVQTIAPEHPAIRLASEGRYEDFVAEEGALRAELSYPPAGRIVRAVFDDTDEEKVLEASIAVARAVSPELDPGAEMLLGPAPAPLSLLRGRHRHHLMIKVAGGSGASGEREPSTEHIWRLLAKNAPRGGRPRMTIDVDPASLL